MKTYGLTDRVYISSEVAYACGLVIYSSAVEYWLEH